MNIVDLSIIAIGTKTTAVDKYVKAALKELEKQGVIRAKPEAMGTVIEAKNPGYILKAVEIAHNYLFESGVKMIVTEMKIDDRRDEKATIESKTEALK